MRWNIAQWFEKRWWKNYLHQKEPSQYLDWKHNYWDMFLGNLNLDLKKPSQLLDAGCGPAGIFIRLHEHHVTALDPLLDTYRSQLPHFDVINYPYVNFRCQKLEELNENKTYDGVFCLNVINHVEDLNKCLKNLIGSIKPEGFFVMSIDSHNYKLPKWIFRAIPLDILHPHQYDLSEYCLMVKKEGVTVEEFIRIKSGFLFDYYAIVCKKY